MKRGARFSKVKARLGDAYNINMAWLSVAVRAHTLLSKGYGAVQDRLEPEVQEKVGGALNTYTRRRKQVAALDTNLRRVGNAVQEAFPEYLS